MCRCIRRVCEEDGGTGGLSERGKRMSEIEEMPEKGENFYCNGID